VTRSNFSEVLPVMRQALKECSFYSFDLGAYFLCSRGCVGNLVVINLVILTSSPHLVLLPFRLMVHLWNPGVSLTTNVLSHPL